MPADNKPMPAARTSFSFVASILIAAAVIGFATLHIVGDALLNGSSAAAQTEPARPDGYGD